ncbi:MAG: S-layer homology domain-containing protein [Clostridia bacterium]|nr:S-layer homology domain-containing protein [Clostridia bacterium]
MSSIKKYITFLCIICMLFTLVPAQISVSAEGTVDILEFLTMLDKDPAYLASMSSSLVTVDSLIGGEEYVLRDTADMDMVVIEISVLYEMTAEQEAQLRPCLEELFAFYADKPDSFNRFIHYLKNLSNFILPVGDQAAFEEIFPTISMQVEAEMYSFTYFMNVLDDFSRLYAEQNGETLFYYADGYVNKRGTSSALFSSDQITGKRSLDESLFAEVTGVLSNVMAGADENECGMFINYLVVSGIAGEEISVDSMQPDEMSEALYQALSPVYSQKQGFVLPFESAETIFNEYKVAVEQAKMTEEGNRLIREAMSRAATIKISSEDVTDGDSLVASFGGDDVFTFAYINARKVRNLFVQNNVPVPKSAGFDLSIAFDRKADRIEVSMPASVLDVAANGTIKTYNIVADKATASLITDGAKDMFDGNITVSIWSESSKTKLPEHAAKIKNADVLSVNISDGGAEITEEIPADVMKLIIADGKTENNYYAIDDEGECTEVADFDAANGKVSFALGEGRMFVYVPEFAEETEPTEETKPTTSPKPTKPPVSSNTDWGDTEDETEEPTETPGQTTEPETTIAPEQTTEPEPVVPEIKVEFSDVPETHWAREYIYELAKRGIINGTGENLFAPEANITREQFAKILVEAFGLRDDTATCDFTDVKKGEWYEIYVASAQKYGIINGIGDGLFGVGQNITRQDMAVMITRAAQAANVTIPAKKGMPAFSDYASVSSYATVSIRILTSGDIINGFEDNTFRPFANATRAQAAKMIYMLILQ